ncbi:MAG: hypothetical protein WCP96_11635 [Methylococcaceae bacterium]
MDFSQKVFNKSFLLSPKINIDLDADLELGDLKCFITIFNNISENARKDIQNNFKEVQSKATTTLRLNNSDVFEISIGKRVITKEIEETKKGIPVSENLSFQHNFFLPATHS